MRSQARSPEELEALFEDALILGDCKGVVELFEAHAVLVAEPGMVEARGAEEIVSLVMAMHDQGWSYLADPRRIVQANSTTLVVSERAINVIRRGSDGGWRYAISLINSGNPTQRSDT